MNILIATIIIITVCFMETHVLMANQKKGGKNATDLTSVSWAHAVNSVALLKTTLAAKTINMIEADVVIGKINGTGATIPIMGHPPANTSDLSLEDFLTNITTYDSNNKRYSKGIKLDFKSVESFNQSQTTLSKKYPELNIPFWLNADILSGPTSTGKYNATPVDPEVFLSQGKHYPKAVLSLGWVTTVTSSNLTYTDHHVQEMHTCLRNHNVSQPVTFAVRAGVAAESIPQMKTLLTWPNSTLTVWYSVRTDPINVTHARNLIAAVGRNKVYLDCPADLKKKILSSSSMLRSSVLLPVLAVTIVFWAYLRGY